MGEGALTIADNFKEPTGFFLLHQAGATNFIFANRK